jgi:hypothetical protein
MKNKKEQWITGIDKLCDGLPDATKIKIYIENAPAEWNLDDELPFGEQRKLRPQLEININSYLEAHHKDTGIHDQIHKIFLDAPQQPKVDEISDQKTNQSFKNSYAIRESIDIKFQTLMNLLCATYPDTDFRFHALVGKGYTILETVNFSQRHEQQEKSPLPQTDENH